MKMKRTLSAFLLALSCLITVQLAAAQTATDRWSESRAANWYQQQGWLVGSNYVPASAINQLEMWQADTFNPSQIDTELGWAEGLGMNTMRVFLHDKLWQQDPEGFKKRIDAFLTIASRHHIRPLFVLFDSCWDPNPRLGPQHPPIPGVHNSGWVQSPGAQGLQDSSQYPHLKDYVTGVVGAFANDNRILAWDIWNEPDNGNVSSYAALEPANKVDLVATLLPQAFAWARSVNPSQPLTSGVWQGDWSSLDKMSKIARIQLEHSDVITFHNYGWPEEFEGRVKELEQYHRPIICTEFMARPAGSTFDAILPIAKAHNVAAINWGFVVGKTQTNLPWDSWQRPYVLQPPVVWFHEVLKADGTPYRPQEAIILRQLTGRGKQ
jgi:hypothetical protein